MKEKLTKEALQDFRANLVSAKEWECAQPNRPQGSRVVHALERYGIQASSEVRRFISSCKENRRASVTALFDNSIAAIDKRIARMK